MNKRIEQLKQMMRGRWRSARMEACITLTQLRPGHHVLDLGGTPSLWEMVDFPLTITLLNLPSGEFHDDRYGEGFGWIPSQSHHTYQFVHADACRPLPFSANAYFDLIFSNSLIEHVPDPAALAHNIQHAGSAWWVQTPSRTFPIEAHCNLPFWWQYPTWLQAMWLRRWQRIFPFAYHQMRTTIGFDAPTLRNLFPSSELYIERFAHFAKSYSVYRPITRTK